MSCAPVWGEHIAIGKAMAPGRRSASHKRAQ